MDDSMEKTLEACRQDTISLYVGNGMDRFDAEKAATGNVCVALLNGIAQRYLAVVEESARPSLSAMCLEAAAAIMDETGVPKEERAARLGNFLMDTVMEDKGDEIMAFHERLFGDDDGGQA